MYNTPQWVCFFTRFSFSWSKGFNTEIAYYYMKCIYICITYTKLYILTSDCLYQNTYRMMGLYFFCCEWNNTMDSYCCKFLLVNFLRVQMSLKIEINQHYLQWFYYKQEKNQHWENYVSQNFHLIKSFSL